MLIINMYESIYLWFVSLFMINTS